MKMNLTKIPIQPYINQFKALNPVDLIAPNLYLGGIDIANNADKLKELKITHILTIEDASIDVQIQKRMVYKFKLLSDNPYSNILDILDECVQFIDTAVQGSNNVLVHCFAGVSRSASVVIAYLMTKQRQSFKEVLELVKSKRAVRPNPGFVKQLQLFEIMNFKVSRDSAIYRSFKLENISTMIRLGNRFNVGLTNFDTLNVKEDENATFYSCKQCRLKLFSSQNLMTHIKGFDGKSQDWKTKLENYKKFTYETDKYECSEELFIQPLYWFYEKLDDFKGKLNCPKCDAKIGSFDWCGSVCSCNAWVTPAFHITSNRVDISE